LRNCDFLCSTNCRNGQTLISGIAENREYGNLEMWKGAFAAGVPMQCGGNRGSQASNRWNSSILPVLCSGKTPDSCMDLQACWIFSDLCGAGLW
jgi:hypothetical protein